MVACTELVFGLGIVVAPGDIAAVVRGTGLEAEFCTEFVSFLLEEQGWES